MTSPVLYGPPYSTCVRSARLALEEKGVAYELVDVDIFAGANREPEHLSRHPFGKVPAFEHDGFALYETCAIMRYVDEAFDGPALQPARPRGRARMTQAIGIIDCYASPTLISRIVIPRLTKQTPDEAVLPDARCALAALEDLIEDGPYLAGDAVSLADLHLVPIYHYVRQTPEGEILLADTPKLRHWWSATRGRATVERTTPSLG
ncbi:MAG: glutathione S-transferase family protein [Kiloniellaceae bacterium]